MSVRRLTRTDRASSSRARELEFERDLAAGTSARMRSTTACLGPSGVQPSCFVRGRRIAPTNHHPAGRPCSQQPLPSSTRSTRSTRSTHLPTLSFHCLHALWLLARHAIRSHRPLAPVDPVTPRPLTNLPLVHGKTKTEFLRHHGSSMETLFREGKYRDLSLPPSAYWDRGLAGRSELIGPPNRFDTEFPIAYALTSPRSVLTVMNEYFVRHEGALTSLEVRRGPGSETDSDLVS